MPTILRFEGYRVVIFPTDHRPSHVHVVGSGSEAVFVLNCPEGPPELRESHNCKRTQISKIMSRLSDELPLLCAEWRKIHGQY